MEAIDPESGNFGLLFQAGNLPVKQVQFPLGYVAPKFLMMWQPWLEHSQYFSAQSAVESIARPVKGGINLVEALQSIGVKSQR